MKKQTKKILIGVASLFLILIVFGTGYILYLNKAHSTFENYYRFRGCVSLVNKTEDYGFCKLTSGETIKLVKYQSKWFLDGDLPVSCFGPINCP